MKSPRKRKTSFTGRAAVLAVVLAALAIAIAGPLRELISQRGQIASTRAGLQAQQKQLEDLQAQEKQWADPSYVAAQARERLHYVLPGQVPYVTLAPTPSASGAAATGAGGPGDPWYGQLWSTVQGAAATSGPTPSPNATPGPGATPSPSPSAAP